uniref:Degenerin deg-1 n=2 Tax=Onchocerca TaxID=6281 RepID=A0A8R1XSI2_ONCVO
MLNSKFYLFFIAFILFCFFSHFPELFACQNHSHTTMSRMRHQQASDALFMTASSRSSHAQSHSRSSSQVYPATDPTTNDNNDHQECDYMKSSKSRNDYSNNYMKYIQSTKLPLKYKSSLDELCYQSCYDNHAIPYHYQSNTKINGNNHLVIKKIRNFSENTTAHGVRRIFIARNTHTARLWLFGIVLCFIILIVQAYQLVMKFNRYEKITGIELKFDYVQFPAVTFCNLNPYKKGLVQSVPSVKDTMDVYENAKSFRKNRKKQQQLPIGITRKQHSNIQKEHLLHLFDNEMINDLGNVQRRLQRRHLMKDLFDNNHIIEHEIININESDVITDNITTTSNTDIINVSTFLSMATNPINDKFKTIEDINDATTRIPRNKRMAEIKRYEPIEAHCKCIGKPDMECIRFESKPSSDNARCICTYDNEMNIAWPCFNISIWHEEECNTCFEDGFCEPKEDQLIVAANWPCLCRNRTTDSKRHCLRTLNNVRQLWMMTLFPSTTTTTTTTEKPTTTTTTKQSARVTAPETVKAMGFSGMTDGVAMLTRAKENLIFTMSALSEVQRIALSHSKREFIEMCSFNGKECDIDADFKLHVDPEFGNCYTFNWDINNNHTSSKAGPMYGIRLLLFVNTSDYMATSESAGIRLAVHSPTDFPFPDTFGYSAPVGFASSFGLKKHVVQRLSAPYGDCQREKKMNSSVYIYGDYDYNPEGCHRSCFQNTLLDKCGCGDPRFPVPKGRIHCSAFNATARGCLERTIDEIGDFHHITDNLKDCQCKQSCEHEIYSVTFSASKWPSGASDLGNCDPNMSDDECRKFYAKNAAMVEVYYEQLNYELLKESEAYGLVNLLADVGGHLGLWMGFSVITIIECAVLFFDLVTLCCNRLKEKKEFRKTTIIQERQKKQKQSKEQYDEVIGEEIPKGNEKNEQFIEYYDKKAVQV